MLDDHATLPPGLREQAGLRPDRLVLALGDDQDEGAVPHHLDHAAQLARGGDVEVHRGAVVRWRQHRARVEHAGQVDVLRERG